MIIPGKIVKRIKPEPLGFDESLMVAGGGKVRGPAYLLRVVVQDPKTRDEREAEVEAVRLKGERARVLGIALKARYIVRR